MHPDSDGQQIDPRYWLRPDESVVNEFRAAKGDVVIERDDKGRITHVRPGNTTLLDHLIQRGVLEDHHGYYAMVLADLRHYFRRRVDYKPNSIYALEFFSGSNSGVLETIYLRVMRLLTTAGKQYERSILFVCGQPATAVNVQAAYTGRYDCRHAFEALVEAIDTAREEQRSGEGARK